LAASGFQDSGDARQAGFRLSTSLTLTGQKAELEAFLFEHVYRHPRIVEVRAQAQSRLRAMFAGYLRQPSWLPPRFQGRAESVGLPRSVGDYLAGMTDRYCDEQFRVHFAKPHGV
jgi:dGTPase